MFNKSFSNLSENFWVAITWSIIFMVVLAWDQEKIVVLNLILFCYFLRSMVGESISDGLSQRRQVLLDTINHDFSVRLGFIVELIKSLKDLTVLLNKILVLVLNRAHLWLNNNIFKINGALSISQIKSSSFWLTTSALLAYYNSALSTIDASQNLIVIKTLVEIPVDVDVDME